MVSVFASCSSTEVSEPAPATGSPTSALTAAPPSTEYQYSCDSRAGSFDPEVEFPVGELVDGGATATGPALVYSTDKGVFLAHISDDTEPAVLVDLIDGQSVYDLSSSEDGNVAAWVTDGLEPHHLALWVADLESGDLYSWPGVGAESVDYSLDSGRAEVMFIHKGQIVGIGNGGTVTLRTLEALEPVEGELDCSYRVENVVAEVDTSILVEGRIWSGNGRGGQEVYRRNNDGTVDFLWSDGGSVPGNAGVVIEPLSDKIWYTEAVPGGACSGASWIMTRAVSGDGEPRRVDHPPEGEGREVVVRSVTGTDDGLYAAFRFAATSLPCGQPEYEYAAYRLIDNEWSPLGFGATWLAAGPSGEVAFITPEDALNIRLPNGTTREIATGVGRAAAWASPTSG